MFLRFRNIFINPRYIRTVTHYTHTEFWSGKKINKIDIEVFNGHSGNMFWFSNDKTTFTIDESDLPEYTTILRYLKNNNKKTET